MCDEQETALAKIFYPTIESFPDLTVAREYDKENPFGEWVMLANGAVYSQHLPCRRYVQTNHVCEYCHDWDRFPLMNMVHYVRENTPRKLDTPNVKAYMARNIDEKFAAFLNGETLSKSPTTP